jgi:hypothetical protein
MIAVLARIMLNEDCLMNRNMRTLMTDLRAWLRQLGVTVIECAFVGCGRVLSPVRIRVRTRPMPPHDPFR